MVLELAEWERRYVAAAAATNVAYLTLRYEARAAELRNVREQLDRATWAIEQLPRVN
jgi:hypothetical protein